MLARELHVHSPQSGQVFLKVNCTALPLELVESKLSDISAALHRHAVSEDDRHVRSRRRPAPSCSTRSATSVRIQWPSSFDSTQYIVLMNLTRSNKLIKMISSDDSVMKA